MRPTWRPATRSTRQKWQPRWSSRAARKARAPRSLQPGDAVIVAPATYNTINTWAAGIADVYALGQLAEAVGHGLPVMVLPFVSSALAANPTYARTVQTLRADGVRLLDGSPDSDGVRRGGGTAPAGNGRRTGRAAPLDGRPRRAGRRPRRAVSRRTFDRTFEEAAETTWFPLFVHGQREGVTTGAIGLVHRPTGTVSIDRTWSRGLLIRKARDAGMHLVDILELDDDGRRTALVLGRLSALAASTDVEVLLGRRPSGSRLRAGE